MKTNLLFQVSFGTIATCGNPYLRIRGPILRGFVCLSHFLQLRSSSDLFGLVMSTADDFCSTLWGETRQYLDKLKPVWSLDRAPHFAWRSWRKRLLWYFRNGNFYMHLFVMICHSVSLSIWCFESLWFVELLQLFDSRSWSFLGSTASFSSLSSRVLWCESSFQREGRRFPYCTHLE